MSIRLIDINFGYHQGKPIFSNLNVEIPYGRWVSITGKCGSGKTTLVKLIAGLIEQWSGEVVYLDGCNSDRRIKFGFLFQNPDDQFVHLNVEREVAFSLENSGCPVDEISTRVESELKEIGLWHRRFSPTDKLSAGEKQRLALAGMLISEPDIIILDEPSSLLDTPSKMDLYRRIRSLEESGKGIIWVTKDSDEIRLSSYVIKLRNGEVSFCGDIFEYLRQFD